MWLCVAVRRVYGCCFLFHLVSVTLLSNVPQFNWQTASGFFSSLFTFLYCIRVALPANILLRILWFAFLWENLQCKHTDLCLRMDKMCEWKLARKLKHISTTNSVSWVRWEREEKKYEMENFLIAAKPNTNRKENIIRCVNLTCCFVVDFELVELAFTN